jgi:hypothetical protein
MKCQVCTKEDIFISVGEDRFCLTCYNQKMSEMLGVEAVAYPEAMIVQDVLGESHYFRLRKRLDPIGIILEAQEQVVGGYRFQLIGDLSCDQQELLLELMAKTERGMAELYIEEGHFPNGESYRSLRNGRFVGRMEPNLIDRSEPIVAINGRNYSWSELGELLMHYEGFQVKLELLDPFEDVEWQNEQPKKERGQ